MTPERWGVVGGGMLGLTLALRLREQGNQVTVFERADHVGGLASAWSIETSDGAITWDRHYHVTLLSDSALRNVLDRLGLGAEMEWVETKTGYFAGGRLSSVSNTVEFLRLPGLPITSKLRLALTILHGSRVKDWERLERETVERWLTRWSGRATFRRFWLPLLRAKLGESWPDANAAFIWATIQRLYAARRSGLKKEMFGYVPGGYARVLERFASVLEEEGVEIRCSATVDRVERSTGGLRVRLAGAEEETFDHVVVTSDAPTADRLCADLTEAERARLRGIEYQGIVCASLVLRSSLSSYYLTYLMDDLPFTAVVEMTALVDPKQLGGHALVFLPKYVGPEDPLFDVPDAEIEASFLAGLQQVFPRLDRADVLGVKISRVRRVFPIPTLGYSRRVPSMATSVPGLHLVSSAQIVNGTLNVNETVELAERAAQTIADGSVTTMRDNLESPA
ncbi:MAG: NAD(P)/FAD-dependent oxidoreductase [Acidimicrobiia bacterium]